MRWNILGHKVQDFKPLTAICLEDLVHQDNFYRQVERSIDLSFVRELTDEFYSSIGRPSVDPVVFFKLQLIAFFEGIRSERQLMETVKLNLAYRWFIGYDLNELSSFSMALRKIIMSVLKDRYFPLLLDANLSRFCYINLKPKCVMPVQSRANVLAAKAGDIFSVHFFRCILTKQKRTDKPKPIKKPCANGVCGLSLCLEKRKSCIV